MNKFINIIKNILSKNEMFFKDGIILKNNIIESALKLDPKLIELLYSDKDVRNVFFQEIELKGKNIQIFDKIKFQEFINNKEFLPDSYTKYKNKIGLTADEKFLTESSEVVLDYPYKDCVLEGGQTKDEQKRKEIFWNKTISHEDINRIFEPKLFTNWKKYDKKGISSCNEVSIEDNLLIKGNNLIVLHSLKEVYKNKIKLIYIDPPYNTGSDSFGYNDSYNHSTWLTFMKNRLEVAKELLRDDGLIFVHIGDEEMHYLKVLMDDKSLFGEDCFIGTIPRKTRSGKADVPFKFSQDFDWILVYAKSHIPQTALFKRLIDRKYYKSNDYPSDEWRLNPITTQRTTKERPNSDFTMINPKNGDEYPVNPNRSWAVTKDTFSKYYDEGRIIFPGDYDFLSIKAPMMRVFKSDEITRKGKDFDKTFFSSDTININIENLLKKSSNSLGTSEMQSLFGEKSFSYPKNETLMKTIIESCTEENDIVLDYHLGSGTTSAVAHKMNRRYIGIEQMDYINDITIERMKKVINGDNLPISKEINWKGGGEFKYFELKTKNSFISKFLEQPKIDEDVLDRFLSEIASYKLNQNIFKENLDEYNNLDFETKMKVLQSIIDINQIYVNYSDLDDKDFKITSEDKVLNKKFYSNE